MQTTPPFYSQGVLHAFIQLHDGRLVPAPVAIVWRREDCHYLAVVCPLVALRKHEIHSHTSDNGTSSQYMHIPLHINHPTHIGTQTIPTPHQPRPNPPPSPTDVPSPLASTHSHDYT